MAILAGTSGWSFKEWKGLFYPKDLPDDGQLSYYAGKFPTVEINNTFYRMPKESVLLDWASKVPPSFSLRDQGIPANHPPRPAQRRGGLSGVFHPGPQ